MLQIAVNSYEDDTGVYRDLQAPLRVARCPRELEEFQKWTKMRRAQP